MAGLCTMDGLNLLDCTPTPFKQQQVLHHATRRFKSGIFRILIKRNILGF